MVADSSELAYYNMNFKSIFSSEMNAIEIDAISHSAFENREYQKESFNKRLFNYSEKFTKGDYSIEPVMSGWDKELILGYINEYGGVLCALFHFGSHRHFFVDAASLNIPTVAPIAGKSYYDMKDLISKSSVEHASKVKLLEVEGDKVSLDLIRSLKEKRVGGIYVDGNMGPESFLNNDGCTSVDFFGTELSIKSGIARLSLLLKLPILPVFCNSIEGQGFIEFADLIKPKESSKNKAEYINKVMQTLYSSLELKVSNSPASWEYALCLHRWVIPKTDSATHILSEEPAKIKFVRENWSVIVKGGESYWFNALTTKGIKVPVELEIVFKILSDNNFIDWHPLSLTIKKLGYNSMAILNSLIKNGFVKVIE
jgi:lauroyl/myristoyl acyltransferase